MYDNRMRWVHWLTLRVAALLAITFAAFAQQPPEKPATPPAPLKQDKQDKPDKPAAPPPAPTNLKVLKITSGADVQQIMRTFTAGLGVQCSHCHVDDNKASDENPKKEVARQMIRMTQEINGKFHDGKLRVSCYTCHRGEAEPKTAPEPKAGQ